MKLNNIQTDLDTDLEEEVLVVDKKELKHSNTIVVYNDEINSFEHVINSFIDVLKHTEEQSYQLSLIIHHNGKASVKDGEYLKLIPYKAALVDRGLSCEIV